MGRSASVLTLLLVLSGGEVFAGATDVSSFKRPLQIPFANVTPYSPQLATLGKMMFFDPRLSGAQNMNCASCHNPSFGFEVPVKTPVGAANVPLARRAPTILNVAWGDTMFWDGRAPSLEAQAAGPITAPKEMNGKFEEILRNLNSIPQYRAWFQQVFPKDGLTTPNVLTAIATYERTVVAGWAPFDRWVEGNETAIDAGAKRGFALFVGKAKCVACHSGWNFTDNKFHDIGLPSADIGRSFYEPDNVKAQHAFKTPSLRNTMYRSPYMHDGSLATLEAVIAHYEGGGLARASLDPEMTRLELTPQDRTDLLAFLKTLTAEKQDVPLPTLPN